MAVLEESELLHQCKEKNKRCIALAPPITSVVCTSPDCLVSASTCCSKAGKRNRKLHSCRIRRGTVSGSSEARESDMISRDALTQKNIERLSCCCFVFLESALICILHPSAQFPLDIWTLVLRRMLIGECKLCAVNTSEQEAV